MTGRESGGAVEESVLSDMSLKLAGAEVDDVSASVWAGSSDREIEFICAAIMLLGLVKSNPKITS